jgi:hypothetical protein
MGQTKHKAETVIEAIRAAHGVKAAAARALNVTRQTLDNYIDRWESVRQAYEEANAVCLDVAEEGLGSFVRGEIEGMTTRERLDAIKFYLRTKGRIRGFGDRQEITGADGAPLTLRWSDEDDK